jgi:hypothetical protein
VCACSLLQTSSASHTAAVIAGHTKTISYLFTLESLSVLYPDRRKEIIIFVCAGIFLQLLIHVLNLSVYWLSFCNCAGMLCMLLQ